MSTATPSVTRSEARETRQRRAIGILQQQPFHFATTSLEDAATAFKAAGLFLEAVKVHQIRAVLAMRIRLQVETGQRISSGVSLAVMAKRMRSESLISKAEFKEMQRLIHPPAKLDPANFGDIARIANREVQKVF